MIRIIIGMLIVLGAIGNIDYNPNADLISQSIIAIIGLTIMYFGVRKV